MQWSSLQQPVSSWLQVSHKHKTRAICMWTSTSVLQCPCWFYIFNHQHCILFSVTWETESRWCCTWQLMISVNTTFYFSPEESGCCQETQFSTPACCCISVSDLWPPCKEKRCLNAVKESSCSVFPQEEQRCGSFAQAVCETGGFSLLVKAPRGKCWLILLPSSPGLFPTPAHPASKTDRGHVLPNQGQSHCFALGLVTQKRQL